jgi:tRNA 2-thiouridine synthesizing protein C
MTAVDDNLPRPLIVVSRAPYDGSLTRSALDLAMSFAVFGQEPQLLFAGDAVLALLPGQDPKALGRKSLRKVIESLPLYDVHEVLVDTESLSRNGVSAAALPAFARCVDAGARRSLMAGARHVISL